MLRKLTALWMLVALGSAHATEVTMSAELYRSFASHAGFPDELPHFFLFDKQGQCILQQSAQLDWQAESLSDPASLPRDPDCTQFVTDGPGSSAASPQSHWRIQLFTLDITACKACEHVESELRDLVAQAPEQFVLDIVRVSLQP